jgi:hypothetical protein
MDFRGVESVVARNTPDLDKYTEDWIGLAANPLFYLSDENNMSALADQANYYETLKPLYPIVREHLEQVLEGKQDLEKFQSWYAEMRQKTLKQIGEYVHNARKSNTHLKADFEILDAKDRSEFTKIEQGKRQQLEYLAKELTETLRIEAYKHQNRIGEQDKRFQIATEREQIRLKLSERRQALMAKLRHGSQALPGSEQQPLQIPVVLNNQQQKAPVFGTNTGFFSGLWKRFKNGMN